MSYYYSTEANLPDLKLENICWKNVKSDPAVSVLPKAFLTFMPSFRSKILFLTMVPSSLTSNANMVLEIISFLPAGNILVVSCDATLVGS